MLLRGGVLFMSTGQVMGAGERVRNQRYHATPNGG